jgi:Tfp pilus assembly protein PilX
MRKIKNTKFITSKINQRGVVLVISLVFLIALTAVAGALMQNSTLDMKMSGASEQKVIAVQDAMSAVDEVINTQRANGFIRPVSGVNFPINNPLPAIPNTQATADVVVANNNFLLEADCPHSNQASSTSVFTCNVLRIRINRNYGRTGNSNIQVSSGITQQLLK